MPSPESLIFLLFPILFLGTWCFVLKTISCFGWGKMTQRYSAFAKPEGTSYHWQSMKMGRLTNYNSCITFHVSKNGLRIAVFPLFAFAHPPLYFPWSQIRFRKEIGGLFGKTYLYDLGMPHGGRMSINAKMHQAILRKI